MWVRPLKSLWLYTVSFCLLAGEAQAGLDVHVDSEAAILMNVDTGVVLFEKNADRRLYPASTTKIITCAYALLKAGDQLDTMVAAEQESIGAISPKAKKRSKYSTPAYWVEFASSHMGIKRGERLSFRTLLYGTMVASANDAANVIGQFVSGNIPAFVRELNDFCAELGCENTHLMNPHGLFHPEHYTTARDLAKVSLAAFKIPLFRTIAGTVTYPRPKTNKQEKSILSQSTALLKKGPFYYPYAVGGKIGYTQDARHSLVAYAQKDGRTFVCVLLKAETGAARYKDAIRLFEAAFSEDLETRLVLRGGPQDFTTYPYGAQKALKTYLEKDVQLEVYPAEEPKVTAKLFWKALTLPIRQGEEVGEVRLLRSDGISIPKVPLLAAEDLHPSFWHRGKMAFKDLKKEFQLFKVLGVLVGLGLLGCGLALWGKRPPPSNKLR